MARFKQRRVSLLLAAVIALSFSSARAQQTIAFSSVDSPNANWYIAKEKQLYKKYGLDVDRRRGRGLGRGGKYFRRRHRQRRRRRSQRGGGGLLHQHLALRIDRARVDPLGAAAQGKSVGISRVGSSSDVAARVLLRELKLEPDRGVAILQVGGSTERAVAFRTGRIAAFPSPPGTIHLAQGMPHRVLISTADFPRGFAFPYVCPTTSK